MMKTHHEIDQRSLGLARAIVDRIDQDPERRGLSKAQSVCARWAQKTEHPGVEEWRKLLGQEWSEIRKILLSDDESGRRLRQNSPFCGVLTPVERWQIYRKWKRNDPGST